MCWRVGLKALLCLGLVAGFAVGKTPVFSKSRAAWLLDWA